MIPQAVARTALCVMLAIPFAASANPNDPAPTKPAVNGKQPTKAALTDDEIKSLAHFHHVNQMEISMGKLAAANGTTKVKAYGKMLLRDHTKGDRDLMALAKRDQIDVPADQPRDDEEARIEKDTMATMDRLKTLKGKAFDSEFLAAMREGHERELVRMDQSIAIAKDTKVLALFKKTKPVLQRHADKAKALLGTATTTTAEKTKATAQPNATEPNGTEPKPAEPSMPNMTTEPNKTNP